MKNFNTSLKGAHTPFSQAIVNLHGGAQRPRLNTSERQTLRDVCDTLLPSLAPEGVDDAELFLLNAGKMGVAVAIEEGITRRSKRQWSLLKRLLNSLEHPLFIAFLIHQPRRFGSLTRVERERVLTAMATSNLRWLRTGFQAVKRLATYYFYSITDGKGLNPTWRALKYEPSDNPPAIRSSIKLTTVKRATTLEVDVCIVGAGAGGPVIAGELAAAGLRVIVLEAGGGQQSPDFDQREAVGMKHLYLDEGMTATRDLGVAILAGAGVGGGTRVNWQTALKLPDYILREFSERSGCRLFVEDSFKRSMDAVLTRLNVNEAESVVNANNAKLRDGCEELGYRWSMIQRNARNCDPKQCGYCTFGCRHGGKQSTAVTYLDDAQRFGEVSIVPRCRVERLVISDGRVTGVEAVSIDAETGCGHTMQVRAPVVVVAAGAIHSPALLLRSGLDLPAIGHNLHLHPTTTVAGVYRETVAPWLGPPQSILCDEFSELKDNYGFRLETAPVHPGMMALATPWFGARDHRRRMQQLSNTSVFIVLVRDRESGRVRVARSGRPVIEYRPGKLERALLQRGIQEAVKVHAAAGADEILAPHARKHCFRPGAPESLAFKDFCARLSRQAVDRNWATLYSAHQMGTCRMGADARTAVCNSDGEVFGVRGLFIGDASALPGATGVNPMISIMALAHHTAQRIKAR